MQPLDFYVFVSGENPDAQTAPLRMATALESSTSALGWPVGRIVGSERGLAAHFRVSRETVREAVKIVERRGSLRMLRGRFGGLGVTRPALEQVASALAAHLRAIGCTHGQLAEMLRVLRPIMISSVLQNSRPIDERGCEESIAAWLARLSGEPALALFIMAAEFLLGEVTSATPYEREAEWAFKSALVAGDPGAALELAERFPIGPPSASKRPEWGLFSTRHARSALVARRIFDRLMTAPGNSCHRLGTEWDLSNSYRASRAVIRQSLRILADLDMLETRRGRCGGVFLKRPAPVGITRQVFPYFAAEGLKPAALVWLMWELNVAHLRLAAHRISLLNAAERGRYCDRLSGILDTATEPQRWILLQQALGELVRNPAIDTLARCIVTYQVRLMPEVPPPPGDFDSSLLRFQRGIVDALRACDTPRAVTMHRAAQQRMSDYQASWPKADVAPAGELGRSSPAG